MQTKGVGGVVFEQAQIPLCHQALGQVTRLPTWHLNAQSQHGVGHTDLVEHFQRGRVKGACAQILGEARFGLQHHARHTALCQHQGRQQAHGARACNHHLRIGLFHLENWFAKSWGYWRRILVHL